MTCTIIRSARKTLALEVTAEGRVLIRAPEHCTDDEIRRFADSHRAWLQKALDRLLCAPLSQENGDWENETQACWRYHVGGEADEA